MAIRKGLYLGGLALGLMAGAVSAQPDKVGV